VSADEAKTPPVSDLRICFISDVATPHVNAILGELCRRPGVDLDLWYSAESSSAYPTWKANPTHAIKRANLLGSRTPSRRLLQKVLSQRECRPVVVGWSNPTTRVLLPLLDAARRRFVFFTDEPYEGGRRGLLRTAARTAYMGVIRRRATVLATGVNAVEYFVRRGVPRGRVVDAPIPTMVPRDLPRLRARRLETRRRYDIPEDAVMAIAGSRLVHLKGFDVLVRAVADLEPADRRRLRVLLVGAGPEESALRELIARYAVADAVSLRPWMEMSDLEAAFAAADVAIHPSRFDGYGATSLMAMGIGLPIVGTRTAGAAAELVVPGVNGYLYDAEDVSALRDHLRALLRRPELAAAMGRESARLADRWSPQRVADIFMDALQRLE
jgi:glycosyltransferase involved in cell wall biosynthesis